MIICVFTDSYCDFHWEYIYIDMAEVAIGSINLHLLGRVSVYIGFDRIGIPVGRISLPYRYCMTIVTEHICIFIDCTYIEIVTEHTD